MLDTARMKALLTATFSIRPPIAYNMDMANLPAKSTQKSELAAVERFRTAIFEQVAAGRRPEEMARAAYPKDRVARQRLRRRIWKMLESDEDLLRKIQMRAQSEMALALIPQTQRLARLRRPDAIKILYEASGFHNPRVKHEHSGNIEVKLSIPRPQRELPQHVDSTAEEIPD